MLFDFIKKLTLEFSYGTVFFRPKHSLKVSMTARKKEQEQNS